MPVDQPPEQNTAIVYRLTAAERDIGNLKMLFEHYVPVRENELQLKAIRDTVDSIKIDIRETKIQLQEISAKAQERDTAQRESQAALQIRVLWGTVSTIITVLVAVLIGYLTHLIH